MFGYNVDLPSYLIVTYKLDKVICMNYHVEIGRYLVKGIHDLADTSYYHVPSSVLTLVPFLLS
jgi:hypothetical protein